MSKQVIVTPSGPPARGAYSPAVRAREFLFVSGQSVRDRELNAVGETIEEQTEKTIENVTSIIHDAERNARRYRQGDRSPERPRQQPVQLAKRLRTRFQGLIASSSNTKGICNERGLSERSIHRCWRLADRFLQFRFNDHNAGLLNITGDDVLGSGSAGFSY